MKPGTVLYRAPGFNAREHVASRRLGWRRVSLRIAPEMLARVDACRFMNEPILYRVDRHDVIYWALYKGLPEIEKVWGPDATYFRQKAGAP